MKHCLLAFALLIAYTAGSCLAQEEIQSELLLIIGAEGTDEYAQVFAENAELWKAAADQGKSKLTVVDSTDEEPLKAIQTYLAEIDRSRALPLWIVMIGHGTSSKREAFFNLAGKDLSAKQLHEWLEPFKRPLIVINTASCSGAFLPALSTPNRILITATKSGSEVNFASFGNYFAAGLQNPEADLNNDGEISLYECYHYAAKQTADFYDQEGRIATETPLIEDNGDGRGTSLKALQALEAGGKAKREPDGSFAKRWSLILSEAEQAIPPAVRQKRNVLESQVDQLRRSRSRSGPDEDGYYTALEELLLKIATLYQELELSKVEEQDDVGEPISVEIKDL